MERSSERHSAGRLRGLPGGRARGVRRGRGAAPRGGVAVAGTGGGTGRTNIGQGRPAQLHQRG